MIVVDLDKPNEWPGEILNLLYTNEFDLGKQILARREFDLKGSIYRMENAGPDTTVLDCVESRVSLEMAKHEYRAFHATRLVNECTMYRDGLIPLDIVSRLSTVGAQLPAKLAQDLHRSFDEMDSQSKFIESREGRVWLTPMRRFLRNGGCDVFFGHFGGEAIQRLSLNASPDVHEAIKELGQPKVVVCRIPSVGWCRFAGSRLPRTMIELFLEHRGEWEALEVGWDVSLDRIVPPARIEQILDPGDLFLS